MSCWESRYLFSYVCSYEASCKIDEVISIKSSTRNQANDPEWFEHRKNRFTASLCNKLGSNGPKTTKGFKTPPHNIINGNEKQKSNKIIQFKLSYGRYHEPIAIKHEIIQS